MKKESYMYIGVYVW